jgi:hypothetical protein
MRRLVHLALLLTIIVGVRVCGGMARVEDRLNAASRWTAEKTGLSGAKDTLDRKVRPSMADSTHSLTEAIYSGTSRTMDSAELALDGFGPWAGKQLKAAFTAIENSVRSVVGSNNNQDEPQPPNVPESEKDRRKAPSR